MNLIANTVSAVRNNGAYKLMDKAVAIENKLANQSEQRHDPKRYAKETKDDKSVAWLCADDTFNDIRDNYDLKSYREAFDDIHFILQISDNDDDVYYAKRGLHDLHKNCDGAKYVTSNYDGSIVPASANNEIIPFLKAVEKNDATFKRYMNA